MEHIARPATNEADVWVIHGCTAPALWRKGRRRWSLRFAPRTLCGQPLPTVDEERPSHVEVRFCPGCSAAGAFKGDTQAATLFPPHDDDIAVYHQVSPMRDRSVRVWWRVAELLRLPMARTSCGRPWGEAKPHLQPGVTVQACALCSVIHGTDPTYV